MWSPLFPILGFGIAVVAQLNPGYNTICPSKNGTSVTSSTGYQFTYICGKTGQTAAYYASIHGTDTVEKCAATCQGNDRCLGSSWNPDRALCQLYESSDPGLLAVNTVFLRTDSRGDESPLPCNTGEGEAETSPGSDSTLLHMYQSATHLCLYGQVYEWTLSGTRYRIACNAVPTKIKYSEIITADVDGCAAACNNKGMGCKGFVYLVSDEKQCYVVTEMDDTAEAKDFFIITAWHRDQ